MRMSGFVGGLLAGMALLLAGCASVQVTTDLNGQKLTDDKTAEPVAHLTGKSWGIYLTPSIPIISGNTDKPDSWIPFTFFRNTADVPPAVDMVTAKSAQLGATRTTDLTSQAATIWIIPLPFLWYKSVTVSANATR